MNGIKAITLLALVALVSACSGGLPSNGTLQMESQIYIAGFARNAAGETAAGAGAMVTGGQYVPNSAGPDSGPDGEGKAILSGKCGNTRSAIMLAEGDAGVDVLNNSAGVNVAGTKATGDAADVVAWAIYAAAADADDVPPDLCPDGAPQ